MIKATSEIVVMFWDEGGEPVGLLHQNGKREFYRVSYASKDNVLQMLNVDLKEEKPQ